MAWVLFFDGNCAFCSESVRQAVRFDKHERLAVAPLQGKLAAQMGFSRYAAESGGTLVLLRESDGRVFLRSDALIELARMFGGGWRVFALARFIPRALRDRVYRWVADHRHLLLPKSASCRLPDPAVVKRLRE
jgi:predicted DCC family thiol-disulfide oxidoreductase YuxK